MSKKSFSQAPKPKQPTADEILAFEKGGAGHDTKPVVVKSAPPKVADEPTKRLSLDMPESVHTRFKTACSATGRKMVSEMQGFIEQRIKELEAEAGITRK